MSADMIAGLWIFRGANEQKDAFKRNPEDPALKRECRHTFIRLPQPTPQSDGLSVLHDSIRWR